MKYLVNFWKWNNMKNKFYNFGIIHFVGIGGIGMSGIAGLMKDLGYLVQGSDTNNGYNIQRLKRKGIKVFIGHHSNNIQKSSALVYSSAVKINNPEAIEKRIVFLKVSALSSFNNKLRNNSDSNICRHIDETCPQT